MGCACSSRWLKTLWGTPTVVPTERRGCSGRAAASRSAEAAAVGRRARRGRRSLPNGSADWPRSSRRAASIDTNRLGARSAWCMLPCWPREWRVCSNDRMPPAAGRRAYGGAGKGTASAPSVAADRSTRAGCTSARKAAWRNDSSMPSLATPTPHPRRRRWRWPWAACERRQAARLGGCAVPASSGGGWLLTPRGPGCRHARWAIGFTRWRAAAAAEAAQPRHTDSPAWARLTSLIMGRRAAHSGGRGGEGGGPRAAPHGCSGERLQTKLWRRRGHAPRMRLASALCSPVRWRRGPTGRHA